MKEKPWLDRYDLGVPKHIDYPRIPLFAFFDQTAKKIPEATCTVFEDHVITYAQMKDLIDRVAAGLEKMGVKKGDRIGLMLPNIPQFILVYYAVLKVGGVVVAINPLYKPPEVEFLINDAEIEIIVALSGSLAMLDSLKIKTKLKTIFSTDIEEASSMMKWQTNDSKLLMGLNYQLRELMDAPGAEPSVVVSAEDVAVFQYSGGTTGIPKGAVGLHYNLVANSLMFRHWLVGLQDGQETTLLAIPLYHVYGMVVGMAVSVLLGSKMVLIHNPRNLADVLLNIERYKVSFFPGVPTLYTLINRYEDVQLGKYQLSSIKACISGSAPLHQETRERFEQLTGAMLMEGYGLSEAPTATHCNPMYGEKRGGSIGLPLPDVDCKIVSLVDGETILQPGEIGELLIRGPQVMKEYHNQPQESKEVLHNGWLRTGDIARMDADGYFYLVDRKKDLIKVSGLQVWPREVEEVLAAHPKVLEVAVAGIPDPIRGEVPKAWVVLKEGQVCEFEELQSWCQSALANYKIPTAVEYVASLPRTTVGKVLRRELVRMHMQKQ